MPRQHAHHNAFVVRLPATAFDGLLRLINVHVAGETADVALVYFENPAVIDDPAPALDSRPYAMAHEPGALLRDVQRAGQFTRGNAILRIDHQPQSQEPLGKRKWRFIEDRANLRRELLLARLAIPETAETGIHQTAPTLSEPHWAQRTPSGQRMLTKKSWARSSSEKSWTASSTCRFMHQVIKY